MSDTGNDSGSGCLVIVVLVLMLLWSFDIPPFSDEITIYFQTCTDKKDMKCAQWKYKEPLTYTAVKASQTVIQETEGVNRFVSLKNCAVKNRNNWTCGDISLVDGDYYSNGILVEGENIKQSSWVFFMLDKYLR